MPLQIHQTLGLPLEVPQPLIFFWRPIGLCFGLWRSINLCLSLWGPSTLALAFGGSSDLGFAFEAVGGSNSFGSSSRSDHGVLFFGTVSLGTAAAFSDDCVPGGANALGTEVVIGNEAFFCTAGLGEPAFGVAAFGDATFGDATFGDAAFGDAAMGGVAAGPVNFGSMAFGDIALGEDTGLGTDAAFGEDGGLNTAGFGSCCVFGIWADFGSPADEAEASRLLSSVIAPCSAMDAEPFLTTLFLTTEDS